MNNENNKETVHLCKEDLERHVGEQEEQDGNLENTMRLSRKQFTGRNVPTRQHACLELIAPGMPPQVIQLGETEVDMGRSPDCVLQLPLNNVSRRHAAVTYRNEEYYIEDLGSTNGTYVNGISVMKCVLRNQDQIEVGEAKLLFIEDK